jgi:hypothetical protein
MYMCKYVYIDVYGCVWPKFGDYSTSIHVCVYMHMDMNACTICVYLLHEYVFVACICVHANVSMYTCLQVCACRHAYTCMHVCMRKYRHGQKNEAAGFLCAY